jgi:hypothetical protein
MRRVDGFYCFASLFLRVNVMIPQSVFSLALFDRWLCPFKSSFCGFWVRYPDTDLFFPEDSLRRAQQSDNFPVLIRPGGAVRRDPLSGICRIAVHGLAVAGKSYFK